MDDKTRLADVNWLHLGATNDYKDLKKFIADICYDVSRAACINEICVHDICTGFRMQGYEIISKVEIDASQAEIERLRARLENQRLAIIEHGKKSDAMLLDIESHASLEHDIWSSWMTYMFSKGTRNDDGTWTMPAPLVERWTRQMNTPYSELSEQERHSDREQVNKHNDLIRSR